MSDTMANSKETGAVAVEFALLLPLLVALLFGTVELGLLLYNQQVITNASREGARFGIVKSDPSHDEAAIRSVVESYCQDHMVTFSANPGEVSTTTGGTAGGGSFSDLIVTVTYPYTFLVLSDFHVGSFNLGLGPISMQARTVMKME